MEFFNQWSHRLAPHLRWLKPTSWLASVVLGLAVAGAVLLLARKPERPTYEPLLSGQTCSSRDMAKMTAAFRKAGLPETQVNGDQIHVPSGRREAYLATLDASNALPADFDESLERYVAKSNPFASHQQDEVGYKCAIQMKLAKIVAGMRGVETASVQYDEVKKAGFPPIVEKRALVAVRPSGNRSLEYDHIEAIRDTVTGSIGGLDRTNVTVTDLVAGRAYPGNPEHRAAHLASQLQAATQQTMEKEFRQKIEQRLAKYPDVVVGVSVYFAPPGARNSSHTAANAEAPPVLTPSLVSASIDVPKSYFKRVWNERNSPASRRVPDIRELQAIEAEVQQTLERAVAALLPPPITRLPAASQVTVTSYDDMASQAVSVVKSPPTLAAGLMRYGPLLGLGAVMLAIWMKWRGRNGTPVGVSRRDSATPEAGSILAADHVAGESDSRPLHLGAATAETAAAGVDMDESLAARIAVAAEVPDDAATDSASASASVTPRFAFLQAVSAETLASCFAEEHPQTISVLLAHIPAPRAANVLKLLRTDLQAEVVQRLARLDNTDANILAEIERTLEQSWQSHDRATASRPAGLATLEAILAASASEDRPALLERLKTTNPQLIQKLGYPQPSASLRTAEEIRTEWRPQDLGSGSRCRSATAFRFAASVDLPETGLDVEANPLPQIVAWTANPSAAADPSAAGSPVDGLDFDDLLALDDGELARVFRAADPHVALLALTGASPQMADRMLGQLPPREATGLARQMEALGPIRLQDVACAQQQMADVAWQLVQQGSISLPQARYFTEAV